LRLGHLGILALLLATSCAHHREPDPGPAPLLPRIAFSELDTNEDGGIDGAEFERIADALFRRLDSDGDLRISEEEYARLLERPRHHRRGHGRRSGGGWPEGGGGGWPGGSGGPY